MSKKNSIDNNDLQLFLDAVKDVKPIQSNRVTHTERPQKRVVQSQPATARQSTRLFSTETNGDCPVHLHFERPGVQRQTIKKLKQGKLPVEADLDLHGYTAEEARKTYIEFLDFCKTEHCRVVCIVHGKGFGSEERKPVIKPLVKQWLEQTAEVLAFTSAQPRDGGTGAVYVLLKKSEN